jgi:outer membrane beta-barrel protein
MPLHGIRVHRLSAALLVLFALLLALPAAAQQRSNKQGDTIHVVQRRPVLQKGRLDIAPRFGMSINDSIHRSFKVGVNGNYHFSERLYVGGLFEWYNFGTVLGGPTTLYRDVNAESRTAADSAVLKYVAGAELGFAPLVGKFALFNRGILFYDVSLTAGGVWTDSASIALPSSISGPGGTVSLNSRVFLNRWMAVNFEVRDVLFMARLRGLADETLTHVVTASLGLNFYIPGSFEYKDAAED